MGDNQPLNALSGQIGVHQTAPNPNVGAATAATYAETGTNVYTVCKDL